MVVVRPAVIEDAASMGAVHVRAWQAAYRGQMPDEYLDGLRAEDATGPVTVLHDSRAAWSWVVPVGSGPD